MTIKRLLIKILGLHGKAHNAIDAKRINDLVGMGLWNTGSKSLVQPIIFQRFIFGEAQCSSVALDVQCFSFYLSGLLSGLQY